MAVFVGRDGINSNKTSSNKDSIFWDFPKRFEFVQKIYSIFRVKDVEGLWFFFCCDTVKNSRAIMYTNEMRVKVWVNKYI